MEEMSVRVVNIDHHAPVLLPADLCDWVIGAEFYQHRSRTSHAENAALRQVGALSGFINGLPRASH